MFSLIWIGWTNGSLYIELHGREDGRTRVTVFGQMAILALLAVFTADASDRTGAPFALVYAAFLGFLTLALALRPAPGPSGATGTALAVTRPLRRGHGRLGHGDRS